MKKLRAGTFLPFEKKVQLSVDPRSGGSDIFSLSTFTAGKTYQTVALVTKRFTDGETVTCLVLLDDENAIVTRASKYFKVVEE